MWAERAHSKRQRAPPGAIQLFADGGSWFAPVPSLLEKATRRSPNEHLSFGDGIHFGLDAASARIQGRVVITMLLERFARLGFADPGWRPVFRGSTMARGLTAMPVRIDCS
jgi:cytochrome P450